ncbi:MAG: type III-B CRISPR module-associated protein Cmr3 [Candidatus Parabeggiatoa sp.]|nr:type III-B CRISPR module-associated protein Cmr3 [Candidatus Parabeggiatoa sp.]
MSPKQWCFEPFDTWFFRESRPLDTISGSELSSLFPPPARTVLGAIRSLIGENLNVNWHQYPDKYTDIVREIGGPRDNDFGQLTLKGPFLIYQEKRLYPVPLSLMQKKNGAFCFLQIGQPVHCDLGKQVRLPKLLKADRGAKPLNQAWLTEDGLRKVLNSQRPEQSEVIHHSQLFHSESRLGIVRDRKYRATQKGLLYQAQHLRFEEDIKIGVKVSGISEGLHPTTQQCTRFGAEGRLATVEITDKVLSPPNILPENPGQNLLLMLLTPADLGCQNENGLPTAEFNQVERDINGKRATVWEINLNGIELTVISAVLGKAIREGGWNLRLHAPRPLKSLVPAGSVWFCKVKDNLSQAIEKLNGYQIGKETALGRGELIAGIWTEQEN